jgi:predicted naringenin-chalcone synthase
MGFELREGGFHIVLSRDVPQLIRERIRELVEDFLQQRALRLDEFILHEWLTTRTVGTGAYGLAAAFGPGFSAELLLLQWT